MGSNQLISTSNRKQHLRKENKIDTQNKTSERRRGQFPLPPLAPPPTPRRKYFSVPDSDSLLKLENVFVKHYAPNHMPDPKGEWSLKENNSELHNGICSKVNQFIHTLVYNYMPNIRILAKAVLQIFCPQGCSYTNDCV